MSGDHNTRICTLPVSMLLCIVQVCKCPTLITETLEPADYVLCTGMYMYMYVLEIHVQCTHIHVYVHVSRRVFLSSSILA